jgi:hypothetical protein
VIKYIFRKLWPYLIIWIVIGETFLFYNLIFQIKIEPDWPCIRNVAICGVFLGPRAIRFVVEDWNYVPGGTDEN